MAIASTLVGLIMILAVLAYPVYLVYAVRKWLRARRSGEGSRPSLVYFIGYTFLMLLVAAIIIPNVARCIPKPRITAEASNRRA